MGMSFQRDLWQVFLVFLAVTVSFPVVNTGDTAALTLEEAVRAGLQNNHRIKQYRALTEAQRRRVESLKSAFWPEITLGYTFSRQDNVSPVFQNRENSLISGEITYNLFKGLSDLKALEESEAVLDSTIYELRAMKADIRLQIKQAYVELLRERRGLKIAEDAVRLLERQAKDARAFYREGLIAKNDLLKVEVELASAVQERALSRARVRIAKRRLERLIGITVDLREVMEITAEDTMNYNDEEKLRREMLQRRSELKFIKALKRARELRVQGIWGGYLPSITLSLTHERYGDSFVPDGRADLFDTQSRAMMIARWNIFDGFSRKYQIEAERSEMLALEERLRDTKEELLLQLTTVLENYRTSIDRLKVARKAVEQAGENYRITENRFRQRMATTTDLLDARFFLTRAENDLKNAEYDYYLSLAELERVVGVDRETKK